MFPSHDRGAWFGVAWFEKLAGAMSRGMFEKLFGKDKANELSSMWSQSSTLDGKGITQAPKGLGIQN